MPRDFFEKTIKLSLSNPQYIFKLGENDDGMDAF